MLLDPQRLPAVRQMLLNAAAADQWRRAHPNAEADVTGMPGDVAEFFQALAEVRQLQTDDFTQIFRVMAGRSVIIRLLDAPLHEFLPPHDALLAELAELRAQGAPNTEIKER